MFGGLVGFTHPTIDYNRRSLVMSGGIGGFHPPYNCRSIVSLGMVGFIHHNLMSEYRRWMVPGGTYSFTVVCYKRRWNFEHEANVRLLGEVMRDIRDDAPFKTIAMVVLPDHLHCIWSLPRLDADYPTRWKQIKRDFTVRFLEAGGEDDRRVAARRRARGERGIWQRRYWEHVVKDEQELEDLCDYIHYNPVNHGHAASPAEWPWSSFSRFVESGQYDPAWGRTKPDSIDKVASILGE
jgi:putative transposase